MRPLHPVLTIALFAGFADAAPVPKALKKEDDKTAMTGTWQVTEYTEGGQNAVSSHGTFVFGAEGVVTLRSKKNDMYSPSWMFSLDTSASPRRMQLLMGKRLVIRELVYELDGDNLKVGFINDGANPPTKVEPGDGLTLYVMTRDTSAK